MSLTCTDQILESLNNYLKYLNFQRSASNHTLRSYAIDLEQFFSPVGLKRSLSQIHSGLYLFIKTPVATQKGSGLVTLGKLTYTQVNASGLIQALLYEVSAPWGKLSLKTRNRKYSCLKSFFNYIYEQEITQINWAHKITSPKPMQKIPRFLSFDEVQALIVSAERKTQDSQDPRHYALLLLLYGGGLRINEACNIEKNQFKNSQIVVDGKGGKQRVVVLPEPIWGKINKLLKPYHEGKYIWGEQALHTQKAYRMIVELGKKAKLLKPISPHALRHSYATHILSSGMNLRALQKLLGHSSLKATEKYLHLSLDQLSDTLSNNHPLHKRKE